MLNDTRPFLALLRGLPLPQSDAELEILTEYYFGTPLHLEKLTVRSYRVKEIFDDYDLFKGNYDAHGVFWDWALVKLTCGGTAAQSYGQFDCRGYRHRRRLERWICSRRQKDSRSVRPTFAKVSQVVDGPGENTLNRCRGVL